MIENLMSIEALLNVKEIIHRLSGKLILTNGCFDLIHPGHVKLFKYAFNLMDDHEDSRLVVAVNTDNSIRHLKGEHNRPIFSLEQRLTILSAIRYIDYLITFNTISVLPLIKKIKPDILVKGGNTKYVVGSKFVESYGGRVVRAPKFGDISTTSTIEKLRTQ